MPGRIGDTGGSPPHRPQLPWRPGGTASRSGNARPGQRGAPARPPAATAAAERPAAHTAQARGQPAELTGKAPTQQRRWHCPRTEGEDKPGSGARDHPTLAQPVQSANQAVGRPRRPCSAPRREPDPDWRRPAGQLSPAVVAQPRPPCEQGGALQLSAPRDCELQRPPSTEASNRALGWRSAGQASHRHSASARPVAPAAAHARSGPDRRRPCATDCHNHVRPCRKAGTGQQLRWQTPRSAEIGPRGASSTSTGPSSRAVGQGRCNPPVRPTPIRWDGQSTTAASVTGLLQAPAPARPASVVCHKTGWPRIEKAGRTAPAGKLGKERSRCNRLNA